jgi:2-alkyl-3-oxoalkanoate reductase
MLKVAILGANGFIGSRTVEMLHLEGLAQVRPIVRSMYNLARLSKFDLDCRVADAFNQSALRTAFEGCDIVVHAIAGDHKTIVDSLAPTYYAAEAAGIRRIVYLSSASVHGQSPTPGTDEKSTLDSRQPVAYNNSKVFAEEELQKFRKNGSVEVVMLRPGIVFGPRSFWVSSFASDLLSRQTYLINRGQGICNSIYIDNLIHAIYLAYTIENINGEVFIVGDNERITWADLYKPISEALGFDLNKLPEAVYQPITLSRKERVKEFLDTRPARAILSVIPDRIFRATKASVSALLSKPPQYPSPWTLPKLQEKSTFQPIATLEMTLLYQCQYKLPDTKARNVLGYQPIVTFEEAMRRSIGWLAFAGYPVVKPAKHQDATYAK